MRRNVHERCRGDEAFSVIRDAMAATEMVGISRLVLNGRERAVMLEPRDLGIVAWTLRFGDEVRDPNLYFGDIKSEKHDPNLTSLVATLIDEKTKPWTPSMVTDPVQDRLLEIIASKKKGNAPRSQKLLPSALTMSSASSTPSKRASRTRENGRNEKHNFGRSDWPIA
jgi:DNA end-binding protein Ku